MNDAYNKSNESLPTFIITMVGGSGVGKTVFMACMYVALSAKHDMSIEASPNLDRELRQVYRNILNGTLPAGTKLIESKYEFYLLVNGHRSAKINWIDYRGGAIEDDTAEKDAEQLHDRIRDSDAVLVMLDLSSPILATYEVGGVLANEHLRIGRIRNLIISQNTNNKIKSVIFVRTKSDLVMDEHGKPKLEQACKELVDQLNGNLTFRNIPVSAAIATSSCKITQNELNEKKVERTEPKNTEWVLFIALKDLLNELKVSTQNKINRLKRQLTLKEEEKRNVSKKNPTLGEIFSFLTDKQKEEETRLAKEADELAMKINIESKNLLNLETIVNKIKSTIPPEQVKVFYNNINN